MFYACWKSIKKSFKYCIKFSRLGEPKAAAKRSGRAEKNRLGDGPGGPGWDRIKDSFINKCSHGSQQCKNRHRKELEGPNSH